jgi:hypothetical protein
MSNGDNLQHVLIVQRGTRLHMCAIQLSRVPRVHLLYTSSAACRFTLVKPGVLGRIASSVKPCQESVYRRMHLRCSLYLANGAGTGQGQGQGATWPGTGQGQGRDRGSWPGTGTGTGTGTGEAGRTTRPVGYRRQNRFLVTRPFGANGRQGHTHAIRVEPHARGRSRNALLQWVGENIHHAILHKFTGCQAYVRL